MFPPGAWAKRELNPRLPPCKGGALPLSYSPTSFFVPRGGSRCLWTCDLGGESRGDSSARNKPAWVPSIMPLMLGEWDYRLFVGINSGWAHPWLDPLFVFFSVGIKELWLRLFFAGLFGVLLWFPSTRLTAIQAVCAWLLANGGVDLFKHFLPIPRPCVELSGSEVRLLVPLLTSAGTASAHSAAMSSVACVFAGRHRWWGVPWVGVALLTGLSRIYVGVHYPSQVLLGWLVGILSAYVVLKLGSLGVRLWERRRKGSGL